MLRRGLGLTPALAPAAGILCLFLGAGPWEHWFGKEMATEQLSHLFLLAAGAFFALRWRRDRLPGDGLLALGAWVILLEEVDWGHHFWARLLGTQTGDHGVNLHMVGPMGALLLLGLLFWFVVLPLRLKPDAMLRQRWVLVPRSVAWGMALTWLLMLPIWLGAFWVDPARIHPWFIEGGSSEVLDLGAYTALLLTSLRPGLWANSA